MSLTPVLPGLRPGHPHLLSLLLPHGLRPELLATGQGMEKEEGGRIMRNKKIGCMQEVKEVHIVQEVEEV